MILRLLAELQREDRALKLLGALNFSLKSFPRNVNNVEQCVQHINVSAIAEDLQASGRLKTLFEAVED